jgi:hypothetical protein
MKYVRYAMLCLTAGVLVTIAILTANELAAIAGDLGVFGQLLVDPSVTAEAFDTVLTKLNLDSVWFAHFGPYTALVLLILLFTVCFP